MAILWWLVAILVAWFLFTSRNSTAASVGGIVLLVGIGGPAAFIGWVKLLQWERDNAAKEAERELQEKREESARRYNEDAQRMKEAQEAESRRAPGRGQLKRSVMIGALDEFARKAGVSELPKV
jgi:hypothetical protein